MPQEETSLEPLGLICQFPFDLHKLCSCQCTNKEKGEKRKGERKRKRWREKRERENRLEEEKVGRGEGSNFSPGCRNHNPKNPAQTSKKLLPLRNMIRNSKPNSLCRIPMYNGRIHTILFECPSSGHLCK